MTALVVAYEVRAGYWGSDGLGITEFARSFNGGVMQRNCAHRNGGTVKASDKTAGIYDCCLTFTSLRWG